MKCYYCVESPDWGGFFTCLGCGKTVCYPCQTGSHYLKELEAFYYDDIENEKGGHSATWYLCVDCLREPPDEILELIGLSKMAKELEERLIICNQKMVNIMNTEFKDYKYGFSTKYRTIKLPHLDIF